MKVFFAIYLFINFVSAKSAECLSAKILSSYVPRYAKHFEINYYQDFKVIKSDEISFLLINKGQKINCIHPRVIQTPVERIGLSSTTFIPTLSFLKKENKLKGFVGKKYIYSNAFKKSEIVDLPFQVSVENLIGSKIDLFLGYDNSETLKKKIDIFYKFNVPHVINLDSFETSPLARAEWIIFNSIFFNQEVNAIKFFNEIEKNYLSIKNKLRVSHPKVLLGSIQNGKWVYAGGKSDLAVMIKDAGGEIVLDNNFSTTQEMSLEELASKKIVADFWLPHTAWNSKKDFEKDSRYKLFQSKYIYNNNLKMSIEGANDYWEQGMQRPDLVLTDLINLFENKNEKLIWYKKL
jgi:iron complex transport system substrate-binding protein